MRKRAHTLDVCVLHDLVRSIDIDSEAGLQFIGARMTWIVSSESLRDARITEHHPDPLERVGGTSTIGTKRTRSMSDLSPECAPKQTSADQSEFIGS
jgi:hypothetical protein